MSTATYSPTRISTFNSCKLKYKYYYIDKLASELQTIEAFRGAIIHEVLEEFYKLIKGGSVKPLEWVLAKYKELWDKNYTSTITIVKQQFTVEDYFNQGKQSLIDYYDRYKPFNQAKVVDTERSLFFTLKHNGAAYRLQGILDRLDWNDKADAFEIHDYKVTTSLMTQEQADSDWQLGLYYIALREKWPDVKQAKLIWHSLLFNKELVSSRTESQLTELQDKVVVKINEIESCTDFPPRKSELCYWCDYQKICPLWKHPKAMEELSATEYKNDPGVTLVSKYAELQEAKDELKEKLYELEEEQKKIKEAAVVFAETNKVSIIDGPTARLKVETRDEVGAPLRKDDPEGWEQLRAFLKKVGKYEDVSTVNARMINYRIKNRLWPPQLIEKAKAFLTHQVTKTVRLIKK
jgi:putative RecB family exonuclease